MDALARQVVERFPEQVGVPDRAGIVLHPRKQVFHEFLRLLLGPDDRIDLGLYVRGDQVDGGRRGAEPDPVSAALFDDLRFFKPQFRGIGQNDAVSLGFNLPERRFDPVPFLFRIYVLVWSKI